MGTRWDLTITNSENLIVLVAEVKTKLSATSEWAIKLRRNILAHGIFPNAPFFLIVLPDRLYIWRNSGSNPDLVTPTYIIDALTFFQPYFEQAGVTAENVSEATFELIVSSWFGELIHKTRHELGSSQQWLLESGLYDAIVGGRLDYEVAV